MNNNYLLESSDFLSVQKEEEKIINSSGFLDQNKSYYDLEETSLENALEDLDTYSFLSSKKIIIIKNIEAVLDKETSEVEHLLRYLESPNPDNLLILCTKKLDERRKITKELKKKCQYIKVAEDPMSFIKQSLSEYKLETGVIHLLNEYTGGNITSLDNECQKLKLFRLNEREICKEDVISLCIKKDNNIENLTFDLANAIVSKNKKNSLGIYEVLKNNNVEPLSLIGLLSNQIRLIYQVKILKNRGLRKEEIAKELDVHPFRVTKSIENINRFSDIEIHEFIKNLSKLDLNIKKGEMEPIIAFEMFLINLD